ncbi:hypothetical protein FN846DRAFT_656133 [Sphaerosporella brunnea]|uniref:Secreted protein n=1 Tax=Sphaerosporella brunnea TaxID=1250544 RepID=A0A5J5EC69_9PEZI|nr:hypothetical protein FN846DRAFT_656133 [Sphaerosporella brunnea]
MRERKACCRDRIDLKCFALFFLFFSSPNLVSCREHRLCEWPCIPSSNTSRAKRGHFQRRLDMPLACPGTRG